MSHDTTAAWVKAPSVMTGGKRYFHVRLSHGEPIWRRRVVWDRRVLAYRAEYDRARVLESVLVGFYSTVAQGKRAVDGVQL
jgi:hypothetical protein